MAERAWLDGLCRAYHPIEPGCLLLIKPGQECGEIVDGFGGEAEPCRADMIAQPIKAFVYVLNGEIRYSLLDILRSE